MNRLMIATGFPVFANRFHQVLNYPSPGRERFPDSIANKSAFDTDILTRAAEIRAVFIQPMLLEQGSFVRMVSSRAGPAERFFMSATGIATQ